MKLEWDQILLRKDLQIKRIINLGRGRKPTDEMPKIGNSVWRKRLENLVAAAEDGRLKADCSEYRPDWWNVRLVDLWNFAISQDESWKWLRRICKKWADAQGTSLDDLVQSPFNYSSVRVSNDKLVQWYKIRRDEYLKKKIRPSQADDLTAAIIEFGNKVTRSMVLEARNEHAPPEWDIRRRGRPRINPPK